jgi:hypothetical protein
VFISLSKISLHHELLARNMPVEQPADMLVAQHMHTLFLLERGIAIIVPIGLFMMNLTFVLPPDYEVRTNIYRFIGDFCFWVAMYVPLIVLFFRW